VGFVFGVLVTLPLRSMLLRRIEPPAPAASYRF
jgi:hypothetical protein